MKQVFKLLAVLALTGFAVFALAQNTIGGTTISNTATATFTDSSGQSRTTQSNTVVTTVQTVYSFNVETDDGRNPAATPNFTGYTETDGINDKDVNAGSTVTFAYTVTNNTNNDNTTADGDPIDQIPVTLSVVQASGTDDQFDLTGVSINVYTFTDTNSNGIYDEGTDTLGATPVATGTTSVTYNFQSQGDRVAVIVSGTVPATRNGNDIALIDLRATNDDATVDNTAAGANVYYENQNVARVEVNEVNTIGVADTVTSVTNNGDGTYTVVYTINVENLGNTPLSYVQLTDPLGTTFTGATSFTVNSVTSSDFTVNPSFNGTTNTNLLTTAAGNALPIAGTGSVVVSVTVTPGSNLGPYNNQITATGFSPDAVAAGGFNPTTSTVSTTDLSDNGTNPDPDNDNVANEAGENDVTPVTFVEDRGLGLALNMSTPTAVVGQPGIFETTLTYTIQNLSDATNGTDLCNIQISQNLNQVFPSPSSITSVGDPTLVSSDDTRVTNAAMNTNFDGGTNQNILNTGSSVCLGRGDTAVITVVVRFDPNGASGPFTGQATATGTTPAGTTLTDLSDAGTNPDQDGDGKGNEQTTAYDLNRDGTTGATEGQVADTGSGGTNNNSNGNGTTTNENDPTSITLTELGRLGVAKRVSSIVDAPTKGQFDVTFVVTLENMGTVNLNSVQVVDDLATQLGTPAQVISIVSGPTVSIAVGDGTLTANNTGGGAYNGTTSTNLLTTSTGNVLRPGKTATVTFTARIDPNGDGTLVNQATGTATTPGGTPVTDNSTDGTDPDVDGNNTNGSTDNDGNPNENTPTPIDIPELPELGVALAANTPVNNGDGTYTITYTVTLENLGNVDLSTLQVPFPLTGGTAIPLFTATQVESATVTGTTGGLTSNASYNGEGVNNLLAGTDGLTVGSSGTITVQVVVRPGTTLGSVTTPYQHNVTGTASSPELVGVSDTSTNGTDTDTDTPLSGPANNTEANDDSDPTPVFFSETPRLGVAKAATAATDAAGFPGQFNTTFTFLIENLGDVPLSNVQATDNLNTTFGAGNYTVTSVSGAGSNASFNGNTVQNLLAAGQSLAVDARITVTVAVRFNPAGQASPLNNTATATATSPGSSTAGNVTDTSTNGNDTDPDTVGTNPVDNLDASDDSVVTPITFTERPSVGIAKAATLLDANTDGNDNTAGPYSVRFDYTLVNLGNVALTSIAITEDLAGQLGGASNYIITSAPSVTTAPTNGSSSIVLNNPAFDGNATTALLGTGSTLAVNDSAVISVTVRITNPGAYTNSVTATANGPAGRGSTTDTSDSGTDPDTNDDGDGADTGESDPTPINLDAVRLLKSAKVCADATCTTITDATGASVKPGQYIEYTIVASNLGGQAVTAVVVTDPIPTPSRYMTSSLATTGITCSTAGVGGPFAACPATPATGSTTVTHVRFASVNLTANDNAAGGTDETTVKFVVYVP